VKMPLPRVKEMMAIRQKSRKKMVPFAEAHFVSADAVPSVRFVWDRPLQNCQTRKRFCCRVQNPSAQTCRVAERLGRTAIPIFGACPERRTRCSCCRATRMEFRKRLPFQTDFGSTESIERTQRRGNFKCCDESQLSAIGRNRKAIAENDAYA
jgi:hypothetical protein